MIKGIRFIICIGAIIFLASCHKLLEEKSNDEVIPKTARDLEDLLLGSGYPSPVYKILQYLNYFDDDTEFNPTGSGVLGSTSATDRFPAFTWQPNLFEGTTNFAGLVTSNPSYAAYYERIKGCNAVLDYIDESTGTPEEKARTAAEALTLRAYYYFNLVNLHAVPYNENKQGLAVPLKLNSGLDENAIARNTVSEVYNQMVIDLNKAALLLTPYSINRGDNRVNLPAVYIFLSRVHLYMEEWDNVISDANKAIEKGGLLTNITSLAAPFYILDYSASETAWLFGTLDIVFTTAYKPSVNLLSLYRSGDRRADLYISADKMSVTKASTNFSISKFGKGLRTSEAYLNRAEAYAKKATGGDNSAAAQAINDLNELRRNRIVGYTDATIANPAQLVDSIRKERRLELCFEDQRWYDLRRYGMPEINHVYKASAAEPASTYTLKAKDPMYTLPIPSVIMKNNTAVSQNPSATQPLRTGH